MHFSFRPPWWAIFLTVIGVGLFLRLGMWQWHRAMEKEQLLREEKQHSKVFSPLKYSENIKQYQRVSASGQFDNDYVFLLDNTFYKHQVGFDVLVLFKSSQGRALLVDRGWVKANDNRQEIPAVALAHAKSDIRGMAYFPSKKTWVLSSKTDNVGQWPLIIEKVDISKLERLLKLKLYPFILKLDSADPNALVRDWQVVTMKPVQHKGYAVQWFGFAIAALIIFFVLNIERKENVSK